MTSPHLGWLSVLLVAVLAACSSGGRASAPPGSPGLVDVGGRLLYLTCLGEGSPTVVLEAGGKGNSANWSPVQPGIAEFTRVCAYDRAGEGYSSSVPAHHSAEAVAHDLHALLDAARIEGPYVIVGHSFGGRLVRPFANLYPNDVVGMVLVDPGHEAFLTRAQATLDPEEWRRYMEAAGGIVARMQEFRFSADQGPPGDFPLAVLSASLGLSYYDSTKLVVFALVLCMVGLISLRARRQAAIGHGWEHLDISWPSPGCWPSSSAWQQISGRSPGERPRGPRRT